MDYKKTNLYAYIFNDVCIDISYIFFLSLVKDAS